MVWTLLDSSGDLIESFDSEEEAVATLEEIVSNEPEAAREVAVVPFDDSGTPGKAITAAAATEAWA